MRLIGLVGKLQSGKTTSANYIMDRFVNIPAVKTSFGNLLKDILFNAGLCTKEELWGEKTDFSRLMLQKFGTEIVRKQIDSEFWVKKMRSEINIFKENNPDNLVIVIDDVRFINEANLVKEFNGTLIRIKRPELDQSGEKNKHLSETEQDEIIVDYEILNDSSIENLKEKIDDILKEF